MSSRNTGITKSCVVTGASGTWGITAIRSGDIAVISASGRQETVAANAAVIGQVSADLIPAVSTGYIRCGTALSAPASSVSADRMLQIAARVDAAGQLTIANDYGAAMYAPQFCLMYQLD